MRKILPLVGVASLTVGPANLPAASAAEPAERFGGSASARALEMSVLGRRLSFGSSSSNVTGDVLARTFALTASGEGAALAPASAATATVGAAEPAPGGRSCAQPALEPALAAAGLPQLVVGEAACGQAAATGTLDQFNAVGAGVVPRISLKAAGILTPVLDNLAGVLDPLSSTRLGELAQSRAPAAKEAARALDGLLGTILGTGTPLLGDLAATETVGDLVGRLRDSDLVRFDVGDSEATNTGQGSAFRSASQAGGSSIDVLPSFRGSTSAPLLRVATNTSEVTATYDAARGPSSAARSTLVRVESELLGKLPLGLPGTPGVLPLPDLVATGGMRAGPGFVELAPGQGMTLFCDGPVAPLCSEVSVGKPTRTVLPDGRVRVESAPVAVHLFKGLDNLVPGAKLGSALGTPEVEQALAPILGGSGLVLGPPTAVAGIKVDLARAVAEAGGTRVAGATQAGVPAVEQAPVAGPAPAPPGGALPRTGGTPVGAAPLAVPALFGAAAGLRRWARRH